MTTKYTLSIAKCDNITSCPPEVKKDFMEICNSTGLTPLQLEPTVGIEQRKKIHPRTFDKRSNFYTGHDEPLSCLFGAWHVKSESPKAIDEFETLFLKTESGKILTRMDGGIYRDTLRSDEVILGPYNPTPVSI